MHKRIVFKILLTVSILILAIMTCRMDFSRIRNGNWLLLLSLLLVINFIKAVKEAWRGEIIAWDYLSPHDKLIFVVCATVLLIFGLYPIKEELQVGAVLIFILIGYVLTRFIAKKFGSDMLNEFL